MKILGPWHNLQFALTLDYELYGDGSGNIFDSVICPTNKILEICRQYNAKITIFLEIVEYWKIREEWRKSNTMGYSQNPVLAMENQIKEAILQGHDVQLHVHPQWINAEYISSGWKVDFNCWRLGELASSKDFDLDDLLRKGKDELERIIRPIDSNYSCSVLRAGGYNIQPSEKVIKAMKLVGFDADSSVYPGGYEDSILSKYDYRKVPYEKPYWYSSQNDIIEEDPQKTGVLEIPLFALALPRWQKIDFSRIVSITKYRRSALGRLASKTTKLGKKEMLRYFLEKEAQRWDFCLFSAKKNRLFFNKALELSSMNSEFRPFVLIGHPKNYVRSKGFRYLLKLSKIRNVSFLTMHDVLRIIKSRQT